MTKASRSIALAAAGVLALTVDAHATGINWPEGQLLPSLSTPARTLDLISLIGDYRYAANGASEGHETGHDAGDGWICRRGVDTPGKHMVYGPYDTSLPTGAHVANFTMKVDDNTADNSEVCIIDVNDATTDTIIATQTVARQAFTTTNTYQTFNLPFNIPTAGNRMEFRVLWSGASTLEVRDISIDRSPASEAVVLFSSLKGLVNRTQPRIYAFDNNSLNEEGKYTWLTSLGLHYQEVDDRWTLIEKYRNEIKGIVVYDDNLPDTINLASTIAASRDALVAPPEFVSKLIAAPYNLPILVDLRGKYKDKLAVYQDLYDTYWPQSTHRIIVGLNPTVHLGGAREYAAAINAAVVWLDPRIDAEKALLDKFLASMGPGRVYMGWWPDEQSGVSEASTYGIATCASDWSTNLSVFGGMSRKIAIKTAPPPPALENKIYVAFIISDGDNFQYVEHRFRRFWADPARGKMPIGWTLSPTTVDAMPGVLNYLYKTATPNDCLLSGPSGYGYTYPNIWANADYRNAFIAKTDEYCKRAGFRIITIWNTINGATAPDVGEAYAKYAPSLLGITAEDAGRPLAIYGGKLPSFPLTATYCPTEASVDMEIAKASIGWTPNAPRFLIIQMQPWGDLTPSSLVHAGQSLGSNFVVVRPDVIFELIREANHLPIDPEKN